MLAVEPGVNITWTISGPVLIALLGVIGALLGVWRAVVEGRKATTRVATKVDPISNGFAEEVRGELHDLKAQLSTLDARLYEHMEAHARRWRA